VTADFVVAGFLAGAALIIAVGAQNAFVLRQGVRREQVLPVVLVSAGADALLIAVGVAGLGALIRAAPALLSAERYGGALFLMIYGSMAAHRALRPEKMLVDPSMGASLGAAMAACLAFTFLNPHVYLDTVILLGPLANRRSAGRSRRARCRPAQRCSPGPGRNTPAGYTYRFIRSGTNGIRASCAWPMARTMLGIRNWSPALSSAPSDAAQVRQRIGD
jgi:arginine exporter protein ArgO